MHLGHGSDGVACSQHGSPDQVVRGFQLFPESRPTSWLVCALPRLLCPVLGKPSVPWDLLWITTVHSPQIYTSPTAASHTLSAMALSHETILDRVRRVPPGYVTTYGDLCPGAPRHAGMVLSQAPSGVPWWRVVRSDGTWPKGREQRSRLLAEDVPIRGRRVVMTEARIPPEAIL
jgi:methylated-DNA-protein-cysteine methyltransferase-like protein